MKIISLTQEKSALVDDDDFLWLSQWKWFAVKGPKTFYARRFLPRDNSGKRTCIGMHSLIMGKDCDHIDFDGLNNQRDNLRPANRSQQVAHMRGRSDNTSGYKGVVWSKYHSRWQAQTMVCGKRKHLGYFDTAIRAAKAYDDAALKYFGDFAFLNFPRGD